MEKLNSINNGKPNTNGCHTAKSLHQQPTSTGFRIFAVFACIALILAAGNVTTAEDWPTFRFDITRSGIASESAGPELFLQWKYEPANAPKPAWPMPAEEMPRMHSDSAYHAVADDGKVYFGSSVTNKVYSIDAASGKIRWAFFTEGPVRFAPTVAKNRVYVGSDDGYVYCLGAGKGKLIWKHRAGPGDEKVIGNGRIISLWPVRTGVLVDNGVVYFGAGVFPYEGIYIGAVNASDGSVVWKNDTVGDRMHDLPQSRISPHGYLIASKDILYVPSGRAMPAAFSRKTGEFLFHASPGGKRGGTWALLDNDRLISGVDASGTPYKAAYDAETGRRQGDAFGWFPGIDMVLTNDTCYVLTLNGIYGIDRASYSNAVNKVNISAKQRKKLQEELSELMKKVKDADPKTSGGIIQRIDQITNTINTLAEKEKRLRDSSCKWHYPKTGLCSLILAGDILFAGGEGTVSGIDTRTGSQIWEATVTGRAVGLVAADGRLIVSTSKGPIYCFGREEVSNAKVIKKVSNPSPYPRDKYTKLYESAAEKIIEETSTNKGYCLVVDCGQGRLAYELAKRTKLKFVGLENDRKKLAAARKNLEEAGLLGTRVIVEPWDISDLPHYFANLVVSDGMLTSGRTTAPREQIRRVLRPYGGTAHLGTKQGAGIIWDKFVRGKLQGAGSWTHLYANAQNTACSGDRMVKGPFGVLWFGEPGPQRMVERHGRAAGPLSINGRLFIQGEEVLMAYDAYNGTFLWERGIPDAVRVRVDVDGSNLALTEDALYVAIDDQCYRLDPATGNTVRDYKIPASTDGSPRRWGYVACKDNILFGTAAMPLKQKYAAKYKHEYPVPNEIVNQASQRGGTHWQTMADFPNVGWGSQLLAKVSRPTDSLMCGDALFALDTDTGKPLWVYRGKRIPNISVSIADGAIFFVESAADAEQRDIALKAKQQLVEKSIYEQGTEVELKPDDADIRIAVALDAATGKTLWKKALDLTGCGGNKMGTACAEGLLLFFGHFSNHDQKFFIGNKLTWRRITAVSAKTGEVVWSRPLNYLRRPLIVADKIIVEPLACDLHTGRIITRKHPITGQQVPWEFLRPGHSCGVVSASSDTLFYRSYQAAICEFTQDRGLSLFGGIRPGCWLNMISANGLMLMPESSSGCTCSYPLRCSLALVRKPQKITGSWTTFITDGAMTPVKHLAINFGAPGDMKDENGTIWFGYPRPEKTISVYNAYPQYGVRFDLNENLMPEAGYFCRDYRGVEIADTDKPWLFTSGCQGLLRCELPLIDDTAGQKPGTYTVRLGFNCSPDDKKGQRIFDIKIQDQVVAESFDILRTAREPNKAVIREFCGIHVKNTLALELIPKSANPQPNQAPIINFIEIIRDVL